MGTKETQIPANNVISFEAFENRRVEKCIKSGKKTKKRILILKENLKKNESPKKTVDPKKQKKIDKTQELITAAVKHEREYMLSIMSNIANIMVSKLYHEMSLFDFEMENQKLGLDMNLVGEAMCAAMLRTLGMEHPLHDFAEEYFSDIDDDDDPDPGQQIININKKQNSGNIA